MTDRNDEKVNCNRCPFVESICGRCPSECPLVEEAKEQWKMIKENLNNFEEIFGEV